MALRAHVGKLKLQGVAAHFPASLGRRSFGYRRRLWKPAFSSDLPPALRMNAEVARYVAPETTPHKKTWTIHATAKLYELAPELCSGRHVQELAANIVYRALTAVDCKCPQESKRRTMIFRSDLFSACSNLFEVHHVHDGAECIFGVLNATTLAEVSPVMRTTRQARLRELVLETVEEWVVLNEDSFNRVNPSSLFEIVGPKTFLKLVPRLNLNIRALSGEDLEVLFYHLVEEANDLFGTLRVSLSMLPVEDLHTSLGGSSWTVRRVLAFIEQRRSEEALRFFLFRLHPSSLLRDALRALRERDYDTGILRDSWSYVTSLQLEAGVRKREEEQLPPPDIFPSLPPPPPRPAVGLLDEGFEMVRKQKIYLLDGELRPFSVSPHSPVPLSDLVPPSTLRNSPWPQLAFDPEQAHLADSGQSTGPTGIDAYSALGSHESSTDALTLWGRADAVPAWEGSMVRMEELPSPGAGLPLDAIHFVDNAQALSHVLTFLQQSPPAFVGVDLEWTDPHPVSIIQVATPRRVFVIDAVGKTPLYMSVLYLLVDWLLKHPGITKLFFGLPNDLLRLNQLFETTSKKQIDAEDGIVSVIDLYSHRIRRVQVRVPKKEDTPLGREEYLGDALGEGDFDSVRQLGQHVPPHPPREEHAERVFLMGLHTSLAALAERHLGLSLNKALRRSNWNFRPLSAAQVTYAAVDAHVLLRLESSLRAQGAFPQRILGASPRKPGTATWFRPAAEGPEEPR